MSLARQAGQRPLSLSRERYERIYHTIRDRICLLEYEPGHRLSEEDVAREFGVSRTPIRRVLSRLETEGLLESRQGVGTFVTDVDIEALIPVFRLRMELAELIGRLDPRPLAAADLDRVRGLIARLDAMHDEPDARAYARLNMEFFAALSAMIGNLPLREVSERLYFVTHRIWLQSVPRLNLQEERMIFRREMSDILAAMELGDIETVGHIRRSHISLSLRRMQRFADAAGPSGPQSDSAARPDAGGVTDSGRVPGG